MTDVCLPVQRTTFTLKTYCRAVLRAWKPLCGSWPSKAAVGCIWAQYALETGKGAFCWNFNIGNVKYTPGHDYMMLRGTWEIVNGKRVVFEPPHRATWFNAYGSLEDAMGEHLRLLKEKRYAACWPAIEAGSPGEFAVRLKAKGYYTAPVEDYAKGLRMFHAEFMASNAFEDATGELEAMLAADTQPELPPAEDPTPLPMVITEIPPPLNTASSPTLCPRPLPEVVTGSGGIVHPPVYPPDDEPDDAA